MIQRLIVNDTTCQVDEFYYLVALRNQETDEYIMLQRTRPVESNDDDGIYLEYYDQINSAYEIITLFEITPKQVNIQLSQAIDNESKIDTFLLELDIEAESRKELFKGIKEIFKGKESILKVQEV